MTDQATLYWTSNACTDVGSVRELNEDGYLERPDLGLWLVADGMGGHFAGDVASQMVVAAMDVLEPPKSLSQFVEAVERQLLETNTRLREYAIREETHTIGSTAVALLIRGRHAVCLWAGDSRLYRYRDGRLEQISQDHALVEELVERGVLTPEQAVDHPHGNLVTRAVGAADNLLVDVEMVAVQAGDVFILCSDGLEKEIAEQEISAILGKDGPGRLSEQLVERALSVGARDNVTVISVAVRRQGDSDDPGEDSNTAPAEEEAATVRNDQQSPTRG